MSKKSKQNKKNVALGALIGIVAVLLAIVIAIGVGSSGFRNWNVGAWFDYWGKGEQTEQTDPPAESESGVTIGEGMILDTETDEEQPIKFLTAELPVAAYEANAVPLNAEKAYTITAEVTPDNNATNTALKWALAWKNEASEWATGKVVTDYVTSVPNGDDYKASKTCVVTCLQSFGEPIILTVTCKGNTETKSTIQIDYECKYTLDTFKVFQVYDAEYDLVSDATFNEVSAIHFGSEMNVTLECGSFVAQNIFPKRFTYTQSEAFTLYDTYHAEVSLSPLRVLDDGRHFYDGSTLYKFEEYTLDCGNIQLTGHLFTFSFTDEEVSKFALNKDGIGQLIYIDHMGGKIYPWNAGAESLNRHLNEVLQGQDPNGTKYYSNGKIDLCKMTLTLTGTRTTYQASVNVNITKALYSSALSDVTPDQGNVIF